MNLLALFVLAAFPQADPSALSPAKLSIAEDEGLPVRHSASLHFRMSAPGGDVTDDGLDYADLFKGGYGIGLEGDRMYFLDPSFALGGYVSLGFDAFGGDRYTDDSGDCLRCGRLDLYTIMGGIRILGLLDELVFTGNQIALEGRLGVGASCYQPVEATFVIGGVTTDGAEFFDRSVAAVFESGVRAGVTGRSFALMFGLGFRVIGPPDRGGDVTSRVDPESLIEFTFEIGYQFRF